jgi:hypothetical protein
MVRNDVSNVALCVLSPRGFASPPSGLNPTGAVERRLFERVVDGARIVEQGAQAAMLLETFRQILSSIDAVLNWLPALTYTTSKFLKKREQSEKKTPENISCF